MSGRNVGVADGSGSADADEGTAPASPTIRVISGNPTSSEVAAVTAVLASLEAERAAEAAAQEAPVAVSAWQQSRRGLRTPITVGPGQWLRHAP